jgi:hypothetical protein
MINELPNSTVDWAEKIFTGSCEEDPRLARRLKVYAAAQASNPAASTARACEHDISAREGAYRFLENPRVKPESIARGPLKKTAAACLGRERVLAIQDTSDVNVASNALREELISSGSPTGFLVHTALMADGLTGEVIGISEQLRWLRNGRQMRRGKGPESDKWQLTDMSMRARLENTDNVVTVADREADILPFIQHLSSQGHRFVIRAKVNRQLREEIGIIFSAARNAPLVGERLIRIEQRGAVPKKGIELGRPNRPRRDVNTFLQARTVTVSAPSPTDPPITLNIVRVGSSVVNTAEAVESDFEWILLTNEPIDTFEQVEQIVKDYEHRWLIEEFHKCWKTGCRLEGRPLESLDAIERMMTITAPIAVRLLQVHTAARSMNLDGETATTTLSDNE